MNVFHRSRLARVGAVVLAIGALGGGTAGVAALAAGGPPAQASAAQLASQRAQVPKSLKAAETAAEDVVGFGEKGKRADVVRKARELKQAADGPAGRALRKAGVSAKRVSTFRARASRVAELAPRAPLLEVSLAANRVSQQMPGFYARFADPVPASVLRLDYLDREAQLRSLAGQPRAVKAAVNDLASTWAKLRPQVMKSGGATVAQQYDSHVGAIKRLAGAADSKALQNEAVHGLDLVDLLEGVFLKK